MTSGMQGILTLKLALGVTTAIAVSYGFNWPLSFLTPIFTVMFLAPPAWMGWNAGVKILLLLSLSLLLGVFISEYLLNYPLVCVPFYGLLLFLIYYSDTPSSPPLISLFMTLGITMIPIFSFSGAGVAHVIAFYLFVNMAAGMGVAWMFHSLLPTPLPPQPGKNAARAEENSASTQDSQRIRLALVSTIVALSAVIIFFSMNLFQYSLAMLYICIMAGTPNKNASFQVMKANGLATILGGIGAIITYNLLVAAPTYLFLLGVSFGISLFFSYKIYQGGPQAAAYSSGFTTFLVLLGSSTGVDKTAAGDFYLRIAQIIFAGLFTITALIVVEHLLRPKTWKLRALFSK